MGTFLDYETLKLLTIILYLNHIILIDIKLVFIQDFRTFGHTSNFKLRHYTFVNLTQQSQLVHDGSQLTNSYMFGSYLKTLNIVVLYLLTLFNFFVFYL